MTVGAIEVARRPEPDIALADVKRPDVWFRDAVITARRLAKGPRAGGSCGVAHPQFPTKRLSRCTWRCWLPQKGLDRLNDDAGVARWRGYLRAYSRWARAVREAEEPGVEGDENEAVSASSVGQRLRDSRRARGISIQAAAEATCIRSTYLQNLEDDVFDFLAPVYVCGFLRSYALLLGLDASSLIDQLERIWSAGEGRETGTPSRTFLGTEGTSSR